MGEGRDLFAVQAVEEGGDYLLKAGIEFLEKCVDLPAFLKRQVNLIKHGRWIPAFAGMTILSR